MAANRKMSVGIGGFGAIGMAVARALDGGSIPGMQLAAVSANDKPAAVARMKDYMSPAPVMGLAALSNTRMSLSNALRLLCFAKWRKLR
jgi:glyceraldehyde-3-phosphate dehydrogenase/erythrose-4-phosphate dehydrogenase